MNAKIKETEDYELFELLPFNRDVKSTTRLENSMKKFGWLDPYPMHVVDNGMGKLKIKAGHHRFTVARKLGIPVKYIVCVNDKSTTYDLEGATTRWDLNDYLQSYVRCGKVEYIAVKRYQERTGIGLMACVAMMGGESAASSNKREGFKRGTYQSAISNHAETVADIILHCKSCGIKWATLANFVRAISRIAWVEEFDPSMLKQKISTFHYLMEKQPNLEAYLDMLDSIYNRQSRLRVPLRFLADEEARKRSAMVLARGK